ncbi:GroES family chaperonin [Acidipropionibacterium jensenii]|uniref:10 kDa chaperonin n=1 Tax=Acidipropionibacterium jensenii TaxID=1749 RepID=A0A3S4WYR0_9ACTN|nr:co-chaperonin GroES [Acidipropionibacterium jensenii]
MSEHTEGGDTAVDLPIRMLGDRVLVSTKGEDAERRSGSGIVIPATVTMGHRLSWGRVVALGPAVRQVVLGDRVLFDPTDRPEVELEGSSYTLLREEEIHAVSTAEESSGDEVGMYL